jgi:choline dehydrogenase
VGALTAGIGAFSAASAACGTSEPACHGTASCAGAKDHFDVIVVGSGAGGGPLAARLALQGKKVLLLEAGQDVGATLSYEVPARHALSTEEPDRAWSFFVQHHRDAAKDAQDSKYVAQENGILYPRGSALGGSTAVNAMVTVLAPPSDWNRLAALTGDASFRAANMQAHLDAVREWLPTELAEPSVAAGDQIVSGFLFAGARVTAGMTGDTSVTSKAIALSQLFGPELNETLATGEATGFFRVPYATSKGQRRGSRERILDTASHGAPLTVRTGAFVTRVLFDTSVSPPRATGVTYANGNGLYAASGAGTSNSGAGAAKGGAKTTASLPAQETVTASEIVLSAGSFNTPQLLMLSGVGDPAVLSGLGIETVVSRPGVGKNMQDRYEAGVVVEMDRPISILQSCKLGEDADPCLTDWRAGRGVYATPGFLATALVRSREDLPQADLQIFAVPADARGYYPGYSKFSAQQKSRFSWLVLKAHTKNNAGFVVPKSKDPFARPHVQLNQFDSNKGLSDPDMAAMVTGVRTVRKIHDELRKQSPDLHFTEIWPGPGVQTDEDIAAFVGKETWGHHVCCTDRMGTPDDPAAVVDSHFRVIGAAGLRVVDASVFPEIPGTFIALPTFMMSEKAAATMLEETP